MVLKPAEIKVYRVGNGVTLPKVEYREEPEFTDEARDKKIQGSVLLSFIVNAEGRPENIVVKRGLGYGLDENAIKSLRRWRFSPGMKDGKPVAVEANASITFRLYESNHH